MTPDELAAITRRPEPGEHHVTLTIDGVPTRTLADLPPLRDRLLFVGLSPSPESVAAGHYLQGRLGRTFWRRLMLATVLPAGTPIATADDALIAEGHGMTDLHKRPVEPEDVKRPHDSELKAGVGPLWQKVALWRPAAVVFLYKRVATTCAGRELRENWGHLEGVALGGRPCFLMPGTHAPVEEVDEGINFLRNLAASLPRDRA
jgi:double-stranded uracil-DNA glycosylase